MSYSEMKEGALAPSFTSIFLVFINASYANDHRRSKMYKEEEGGRF